MSINISKKFLTDEELHSKIAEYVSLGYTYIEAIIEFANDNDLDVCAIGDRIRSTEHLKSCVEQSARDVHMLKEEKNGHKSNSIFES